MIKERACKNCGLMFLQYRTTQNLCDDCAYEKTKETLSKREVRAYIFKRGKKTKDWLEKDRPKWIKNHPPTHEGYWLCYLMIHPYCPIFLTEKNLTLDHVKPRSSNPSKRRKQQNFRPACKWCNSLKGSVELSKVKKEYKDTIVLKQNILSDSQVI